MAGQFFFNKADLANISGQSVTASFGNITTNISGQPVTTSISGNAVTTSMSGNYVNIASGSVASFSGIAQSVSGNAVTISGNVINTSISGNAVTTTISGNAVTNSGVYVNIASGSFAGASGVLASAVSVSGDTIQSQVPTIVITHISGLFTSTVSGVPSLSGGVALASGNTNNIILRNNSGNNSIYVGGSGSRPFSGQGFLLAGGDGISLPVDNFNRIYVFAATSGSLISYIGTAF